MNQSADKWKGRGKQIAGGIRKATAKNDSQRLKGRAQQLEGKGQESIGKLKEKVKKAIG